LILLLLGAYGFREYEKTVYKREQTTRIFETIKTAINKEDGTFSMACEKQTKSGDEKLTEVNCQFNYTGKEQENKLEQADKQKEKK